MSVIMTKEAFYWFPHPHVPELKLERSFIVYIGNDALIQDQLAVCKNRSFWIK